ncbi:MAG: flavin reductase family protein [Candidatus Cloacimonadia bacterium]
MREISISKAIQRISKPAKLALVVSNPPVGGKGPTIITLEWFMRTSTDPAMFAISIGLTRYSYELLSENRKFVLAIPSTEMAEQTLKCGTISGRNCNKIVEFNIHTKKGKLSDIPLLADAVANFECQTVTQVRTGDHTIFVGEAKYAWIHEDVTLQPLLSVPPNDPNYEILAGNERYNLGRIKS